VLNQPTNQHKKHPRILVACGARALALFSPSCCAVVALPLETARMDAPQRCEVGRFVGWDDGRIFGRVLLGVVFFGYPPLKGQKP